MDKEKLKLLYQRVNAGILMLENIKKDIEKELQIPQEGIPQIEEVWLGDDGKEYSASQPYIKAKQWYCCGKPLEKVVIDGKQVFHCAKCNSNYSA